MFLNKIEIRRGIAAAVVMLTAFGARAETTLVEPVKTARLADKPLDQVIYKGVLGNMLEEVPLDPEQRVELQRANAVISNAVSGRSLAVLLGVASPVFIVGGLAWGIFAASRIKPAAPLAVTETCGPDYVPSATALAVPDVDSVFPGDAELPSVHGPLAAVSR